jgi:hypothetical protein
MLDVVRAVFVVIAIASAARLRFAVGVACGLAIAYGLLGSTLGVAAAVGMVPWAASMPLD